MKGILLTLLGLLCVSVVVVSAQNGAPTGQELEGKRLFETATFGGNGRTCQSCHSGLTGTVSPEDAQKRFKQNPNDPLFLHDGSDDGNGHGVTRMLKDATVLMTIPLGPNVKLANDLNATSVVLRRGIPTTLNMPALDPVIMLDGRQPNLQSQAAGAIKDHAQGTAPSAADLSAIAAFQKTNGFFSSPDMRRFALGGPAPGLPAGNTASEKRGRVFFEESGPDPTRNFRPGLCSHCHSGPLMNQTNQFASDFFGVPVPVGLRFLSVGISEFNVAQNPVREFIFNKGLPGEVHVFSPDPGRALITGDPFDVNSFKMVSLRGIRNAAPYFHDNSAKTLEDVAAHYAVFFDFVTGGFIQLSKQEQQDLVAFMKLLD